MIYFGIDPGQKGGIVGMDQDGEILFDYAMDEIGQFLARLQTLKNQKQAFQLYLEHAQAFTGQGVVSMFNYGVGFGKILGFLEALGHEYWLVHPQTWTAWVFKGIPKSKIKKERNIKALEKFYPQFAKKIKKRTKYDEGKMDACLIAHFAKERAKNFPTEPGTI